MQKSKDEMIDWVWRLVKSFGDEGISIESLFERFDGRFTDEIAKSETIRNDVWQPFLNRDDVVVLCPVSEAAVLKDLELDDAFALGYGVRKVSVMQSLVDKPREEQYERTLEDAGAVLQGGVDQTTMRRQRKPTTTTKPKARRKSTVSAKEDIPKQRPSRVATADTASDGPEHPATRSSDPTAGDADENRQPAGPTKPPGNALSHGPAVSTESDSLKPDGVAKQRTVHTQHGSQQSPTAATSDEAASLKPVTESHSLRERSIVANIVGETSQLTSQPLSISVSTPSDEKGVSRASPFASKADGGPKGENLRSDAHVTTEADRGTDNPQRNMNPNTGRQTFPTDTGKLDPLYLSEKSDQIPASHMEQLAAVAEASEVLPVETPVKKRGRGRPRSTVPKITKETGRAEDAVGGPTYNISSVTELSEIQTPTPRKRGRPRGKTKLLDVEVPPEILNEETTQNGIRSSRRQPKPRQFFGIEREATPERQKGLETGERPTKTAVFTSYEEMQREHDEEKRKAGISGVYINPADAMDGRPKKSLVVLFKSDKLRDSTWLENRMGTWIEVLDERRKVAQAAIEAEAARIALEATPKKRGRSGPVDEGSTKKRARTAKGSVEKYDPPAKDSESNVRSDAISFEFEPFSAQPESSVSLPLSGSSTTAAAHNITSGSEHVSVSSMQNTPLKSNPTSSFQDYPNPPTLQHTQLPPLMHSPADGAHQQNSLIYALPYATSTSENRPSYSSPYGSEDPMTTPRSSTQGSYRSPYAKQTLDIPEGNAHGAHPLTSVSSTQQVSRPAPSWPAGFIPPDYLPPPQSNHRKPSSWPAGFLPPDATDPSTNAMSPLRPPMFGQSNLLASYQNPQDVHSPLRGTSITQARSYVRPRSSSPDHARVFAHQGLRQHDEVAPIASPTEPSQTALQLAAGTKSSSPSTVSEKSQPETGSRDATPMSLVESLSSQGNPNTKKRKRPEPKIQSLAQASNSSAEKAEEASRVSSVSSKTIGKASLPALANDENFSKAESVDVGEVFGRISAMYNANFGNLILSSDRIHLEFRSMAEDTNEPIWTMQVLRMAENPIVSMPGSNPMELRLKEKRDDDSVVQHRFQIAKTKLALEKANDMRAKLVSARIFIQMSNAQNPSTQLEDPAEIAARPWKCEKCGSRFKNKEGIKYHLSKSQTTCNPDFKPENVKPRSTKVARKKKVKSPIKKKKPKKVDGIDNDGSDSASGDSDDSIFEWAEQVAGLKGSTKKTRNVSTKTTKVYKSLPGEKPVLQSIAQSLREDPSVIEALSKIELTNPFKDITLPESLTADTKDECAKSIIKGLLQASQYTLPGDRGLWFAFVACWLRSYGNTDILPEFKIYAKAVDDLLNDKAMTKATFDFVGQKSRNVSRSILLGVEPKPAAEDVGRLKENIQSKHPDYYVPLAFAPPQAILVQLEAIGKPSPTSLETSEVQLETMLGSEEEEEAQQESSDDEFMPAEGEDQADDPMGLMLDSDDDASDDSSYLEPEPQSSLNHARQFQRDIGGVELSISPSKLKGSIKRQSDADGLAVSSAEHWSRSPVLQNAESGAWDTSSKPKRTITRRDRLPEPVTFMQTLTGTWSLRPFGHGVNPIFARPNKRTVGNPNLKYYLQSIEEGHRPVIYPNKTVMLPSVPSKFLLQKNAKKAHLESQSREFDEEANAAPLSNRTYRYNTRQNKDLTASSYTGLTEGLYGSLTPDPLDNIGYSVAGVNELDILNHFEPKPLDPEIGRKYNPGINSLPPAPATPGLSHLFSNESTGLWDILNPFRPATRQKVKIQWPENTVFTLETLPYDALIEDDELPPSPAEKAKPPKRATIGLRKSQKNKWVHPRRLTATPDDLVGTHRDVKLAAEELGIQMTNYDTNARRKRQRFKEQGLPADEEARLTMGIVVVRALLGGLEMVIDWVIVGTVFQDYSVNFLRKYWGMLWNKKRSVVEKLTKDFQEAFIIGYRRGHVDSIDYDHVVDYDWNTLIDWAMDKIHKVGNQNKQLDLPGSMEGFDYQYELTPEAPNHQWSEQYFYPLAAVYHRMNLVNSVPFTYPLEQNTSPEIDDHMLARSWCRAAAVTPDHMWDSKATTKLLASLPNNVIVNARESLLADKIISKNKRLRTNGRVYNLPDTFNSVFIRAGKIINEQQFREAYLFKCDLDSRIRNGETSFTIPWGVNQGSVMAITNLQAQVRIRVQKSGVPANRFGLTEGGYETRAIDKAKYRFQMDVQPTPEYVFNEDIFSPNWTYLYNPPGIGRRGEIPVWRTTTGELVTGMWKKVLVGITGAIALRSSIDIEGIEKVFKPSMEAWEIRQVVEWGEGKGIWKKCDYAGLLGGMDVDGLEGWDTEEWWWNIMGRFLVESDGQSED